ncbi:calcium-binding protein CML35 [Tripterygium wilfordii]|uniref:Calcium-binding protein CML35 n=1 Tax=Tripterygium wilfordii TaxID=458696 RepID=A0A7J7DNP1_TRIWF|nr:probable calcium-binding protein CML36 [Tripterygium wilfordii]KAF5747958.1 calcium-binding protein CML35 [Tripterygium wilfordii]
MTLIKISKLSPKRLFRSKKDRSTVSRSDPSSFSSGTTSSASSDTSSTQHKPRSTNVDVGTPTSVLPEISGDWSDIYLELLQAFKIIDSDNDGIVSRSELEALLSRLGAQPPSREEVATMVREVDSDGDGCISVEALMSRMGSAYEPACDAELREAFEFFDTDHDGRITAEELQGVFAAIGDGRSTLDDCRRMIAGVDKNGDGFVCFDDFCRMMELQA